MDTFEINSKSNEISQALNQAILTAENQGEREGGVVDNVLKKSKVLV